MKKAVSITGSLLLALSVLSACSHTANTQTAGETTKNSADAKSTPKSTQKSATPDTAKADLQIEQAAAKQNGNQIVVKAQIKNTSSSSRPIDLDSFSLTVGDKTLTPAVTSNIPEEVKGNNSASVQLDFNVAKGTTGSQTVKVNYKRAGSTVPKQVTPLGKMNITPPTSQMSLNLQKVGPVDVKIPKGWVKTAHQGGAYPGYDFTNPKDKSQKMTVVYSPCTGCGYKNHDPGTADPHPDKLIPQSNVKSKFIFNSGNSVGYSFTENGNTNEGNGVVTMVQGEGYAYVEVLLPTSMRSDATNILNSFAFHGYISN